MQETSTLLSAFILEAFDTTLWCPVAQAVFEVADLGVLRSILGDSADDDPDLADEYLIESAEELAMIEAQFGPCFPAELVCRTDIETSVYRRDQLHTLDLPYLGHVGYELPLMLDGRKKLAKIIMSIRLSILMAKELLINGSMRAFYIKRSSWSHSNNP